MTFAYARWNEMKIVRTFKSDPHPSIIPFHSFIITPSFALITMWVLLFHLNSSPQGKGIAITRRLSFVRLLANLDLFADYFWNPVIKWPPFFRRAFLPTLVPVEVEESKSRDWFRFLLSGVEFLHKRGVVHNDIKCVSLWIITRL